MASPSDAEKTTASGTTSLPSGKSDGTQADASSRAGPRPAWIAGCAGRRGSDARKATALPSLVGTGDHSRPVPDVSGTGGPPATATLHTCRRSVSPWVELKKTGRPARARAPPPPTHPPAGG